MLTSLLISGIIVSGASIISILANGGSNVNNDEMRYTNNDEIRYIDEEETVDYAQETYDYLNKLTMDEIYEYVQYNDTLSYYDYKIYGTCNRDDKYHVLKHICDIAEREGRSFTNKYSRY